MAKGIDVPGNIMATHSAIQRDALRVALAFDKVEQSLETDVDRDPWLVSIRIKVPDGELDDWFVILQGDSQEGAVVAFHAGTTMREAARGALERYVNKSLKWRPDEYRRKYD